MGIGNAYCVRERKYVWVIVRRKAKMICTETDSKVHPARSYSSSRHLHRHILNKCAIERAT